MLKESLQNTINYGQAKGSLAPTEKQLNTIRLFVYNYKITIKDDIEMNTRQGVSRKISEISKAIKSGKVKERTDRPVNCKVKIHNGVWKLVEQQKDLNDFEYVVNGFDQFVQDENERNNKYFIKQHEDWLSKKESKTVEANA